MKHIVCFSGGHSSALAAIETVRKYGKENVILLNHDVSPIVEDVDIKRFKRDVSNYLGLSITYANMPQWEIKTPLDICTELKAFKVGTGTSLCTHRLKTQPFKRYLYEHFPSKPFRPNKNLVIVYGFDDKEKNRIIRRKDTLLEWGYNSEYPLTGYKTICNIEEIGINRPATYKIYKHANCSGCLKAGKQQWYITYCLRQDLWNKALQSEKIIGYSILKGIYLRELEDKFYKMRSQGIVPTEILKPSKFWSIVKLMIK